MDGRLEKLLNYLENKYEHPLSFEEYLSNRYGSIEDVGEYTQEKSISDRQSYSLKPEENQFFVFQCNKEHNVNILNQLIESMAVLKKTISQQFDEGNNAIKLVNNYIKELEKLLESKNLSEGEKTADKLVKIIKKTLLKLWGIRWFPSALKEYFKQNKIELEEYEENHKLSDDELELLDENLILCYTVKAETNSDKYKVLEMIQPIIKIYYIDDDDERDFKFIPGICRFYN